MSGNQRRLIRIQAVMACGMLALNIVLIPRWGIVGAAVGAAVTNAVTNIWYLAEVRRSLGLLPYSRSHWRLLLPVWGNLAVLLIMKATLKAVRPEWVVIAAGLASAYVAFIAIAMSSARAEIFEIFTPAPGAVSRYSALAAHKPRLAR
jgi:Na+-driven multidrug efflux pump